MSEKRPSYANDLQHIPVQHVEMPPQNHLARAYADLREELTITDMLLNSRTESRDRLLDAIPPCPVHGNRCVPYALEWIERAKVRMASAAPAHETASDEAHLWPV